ncbi:MAG: oligoendopeptidase F [Deltaproteobacteria bacterium SG8_13]|nr:MAG: oligoendopeptidase F [Deltaproteobacteria bacterium SG8_13]
MTTKKIPHRKDVPDRHRWDLSPLFASDASWEQAFAALEGHLAGYDRFRGKLAESAEGLKRALDYHFDVTRRLDRLHTYAHLRSDEDKSHQRYLGFYRRAVNLQTRCCELASFMTPEIQAIADETMTDFLSHPCLQPVRFYLEKILRYKPHTLGQSEEQILAMSGEIGQTASQIFGQLDNVDLNFGTIAAEDGSEVELSHGNFMVFLIHPNRDIRKRAFDRYYRTYAALKNTLATALSCSAKKDFFYARARKFENCRMAGLFDDNVPDALYDNLVATVRAHLAPLFKYFRFRQKALGLEALHFYDTYVPIVAGVDFHMSYEDAVAVAIRALRPLGSEYTQILQEGLSAGWVDRYENRGKRSGAYSSGCYDSPPYILLNYEEGSLNSLYTLVHEAGHSMHSYFANRHQPYVDHQYTIFAAEVASTFNESLLSRYLLEYYADNPRMKAFILNREIDNIRATFYRQTMFAEFEVRTHRMVEQNEPLTLEQIISSYRELLEAYFGDAMVIDPELELECLRIPHFYASFYVYKYATGISAAIALAEKVCSGGDDERRAYIDFLKLGGSSFPLQQLQEAGVDMRSARPVQMTAEHFDHLVDQLIAEVEASSLLTPDK